MANIPTLTIPVDWNNQKIEICISLDKNPKSLLDTIIQKSKAVLKDPTMNPIQLNDQQQLYIAPDFEVKNGVKIYHGNILGNFF